MALTLTIGRSGGAAVSYTNFVDFRSILAKNGVQVAVDTMDFDLWIYSNEVTAPLAGMEVIFKDGSTIEFAGVLVKIVREWMPESRGIIYHCECKDYVYYLDRRMVNDTYPTQVAGQTIKDILTDLFDASDSDVHYEFFKDNVGNIEDGHTLQASTFDQQTPSQVFDSIAQSTGMQWWIDFDKKVYFKQLNSLNATFLSANTLVLDTDLTNFFDWQESESIDLVGTSLILTGIREISTSTQVDNFVGSEGKTHHGNDNKIFTLSRTPFTLADVQSVTKNGVSQTLLAEDIDGRVEGSEGGATDVFRRVVNEGSYIRFSNTNTVVDGDAIVVTYRYQIINNTQGLSPNGVLEMKFRTGGDGVHEFVYSQTSGLKVSDPDQIVQIEELLLSRKSTVLRAGTFKSWSKGWRAGQNFVRKWNQLGLSSTMYIISVTKTVLTPHDGPPLSDSIILRSINFSNIPYGINL